MKIVISNGKQDADYIVSMYKENKNKVIVINDDEEICKYISKKNHIDVVLGDSTKEYDLKIAQIDNADCFIALSENDITNYVACKMAKKIFNVKRCIAIVTNPKNVSIFKQLGIDNCVSSTYLLAQSIKNEASMESMIKTLSLEDDNVIISEVVIQNDNYICNKKLKDLIFPINSSICCIYRYPHIIIPNGNTEIKSLDKLFIVSSPEAKNKVFELIQRK